MKELSKTMQKDCDQHSDKWAIDVKGRMEFLTNDLCAYECIYHQKCSVNFRTGKGIPKDFAMTYNEAEKGRPENDIKKDAFLKTCMQLEKNEKEQYKINELVQIMASYMEEANAHSSDSCYVPYKNQYMKQKLVDKYGDSVCISKDEGSSEIVTMRESTANILRNYHNQPDPLTEDEENAE